MAAAQLLPILLGIAWLIPLASFVAILFFGTRMGAHGKGAAAVATSAIGASLFLSLVALVLWTTLAQPVSNNHHGDGHASVLNNYAGESSGLVRRIAIHSPEQGGVEGHHAGGHEE